MGIFTDIFGKGKISKALDSVGNYAIDNPFQTALIAAGGYYLWSASAATAGLSAGVGGSGLAAGVVGPPTGASFAAAGAPSVLSTAAAIPSTLGMLGKGAGKALATPQGMTLAGGLIQATGAYASQKGASEDASKRDEENRLWQEGQFERQQEARRTSFTPYTRGILSRAKSREPLSASPSQALTLRRAGKL